MNDEVINTEENLNIDNETIVENNNDSDNKSMEEVPKKDRRIVIPNEVVYIVALLLNALGVAMVRASDFGLSMIVAPAYILGEKIGIEFGYAEYIVQGILFILCLIIIRRFRISYLWSFLTCVIYGFLLNHMCMFPVFNPDVVTPESLGMPLRITFFILGTYITGLAIALYLRSYLHPQVYDFFVSAITKRYKIKITIFKTIFDVSMLVISVFMAMLFFHSFKGLGWGTLVSAAVNGVIIAHIGTGLDKIFIFAPMWPKHAKRFEI